MWHFVSEKISEVTGTDFICDDIREVSGGDTHRAYKISDGRKRYFVKTNTIDAVDNFATEASGLQSLSQCNKIRIPNPICHGIAGDASFLVLEHITLKDGNPQSWFELGKRLAELHRCEDHGRYGCECNNYVGKTPQDNHWEQDWASFFAEHRIGHMLQLLANNGIQFVDIDHAVDLTKQSLKNHCPKASRLHGDLWQGNVGFFKDRPVIFDPAFYYGDRETDLAMTELFGRFPASFYQGYNEVWQIDKDYSQRRDLYQLYHILNHALMFGGNYTQSAQATIRKLDA